MHLPLFLILLSFSFVVQAAAPSNWYQVAGGTWTVDTIEVERIASQLQSAGDASLVGRKTARVKELSKYIVQYQGIGSTARHQVRLMGACDLDGRSPDSLRKDIYLVFDGGDCYFHAVYDRKQKKFVGFSFNGVG
jgi:hypothetical protein